jgi:hypothetical protein
VSASSGCVRLVDVERLEPVAVPCLECGLELAGDGPELRLELTCDDEPIVYCAACWQREVRRERGHRPEAGLTAENRNDCSELVPRDDSEQPLFLEFLGSGRMPSSAG